MSPVSPAGNWAPGCPPAGGDGGVLFPCRKRTKSTLKGADPLENPLNVLFYFSPAIPWLVLPQYLRWCAGLLRLPACSTGGGPLRRRFPAVVRQHHCRAGRWPKANDRPPCEPPPDVHPVSNRLIGRDNLARRFESTGQMSLCRGGCHRPCRPASRSL